MAQPSMDELQRKVERRCTRCAARARTPGIRWCRQCVSEWFHHLMSEIADPPMPATELLGRPHAIDGRYENIVASEEGYTLSEREASP